MIAINVVLELLCDECFRLSETHPRYHVMIARFEAPSLLIAWQKAILTGWVQVTPTEVLCRTHRAGGV